jgi:succinate-semialdehyde dehydrogenase / glutarate-semialdehyde dehydrogenase
MNSSNFSTVNPATEERIETFPFFTAQQTESVLVRAEKSFKSYGKLPVHQRARLLSQLATILRKNKAQLAKVITMGMGKILSEAEAEVEKSTAALLTQHGGLSDISIRRRRSRNYG